MKKEVEQLAEQLHNWYLEATKELNPENYNPKAQKLYLELNEQQKNIDRYIAKKIIDIFIKDRQKFIEILERIGKIIKVRLDYCQKQNGLPYCKNCGLNKKDLKLINQLKNERKLKNS